MNIADRIQNLRKSKGISQEELADKIGVSRQAVSKWESEQSLPDIEKICLLSDYFGVTTDYLLKGIEQIPETVTEKTDARIFTAVASTFNLIGLITAVLIWIEEQRSGSVAVGLIVMAVGCMTHAIGQYIGENKRTASFYFWAVNIWFLSLIPISCIFNFAQGVLGRYWPILSPLPQIRNSLYVYGICWLVYFVVCILTDIVLVGKKRRQGDQI